MKKIFLFICCVFLVIPAANASQKGLVKKGNDFYQKGDFETSVKHYEDALKSDTESPAVNFNLGTALYKSKKYADAVPYLQKGLLSEDARIKENAHYNLGNALFGAGLSVEKQNVDESIGALEESLRQFESAMKLNDKDTDARYNYDIVKKELERLKKKKEEQKEQQSQNKQQDKDQKSGQQGNNQKENNSSSQPDSGEKKDQAADQEEQKQGDSQQQKDKQDQQNKNEASTSGEMSKEEAKALLKEFEQNEQPDRLLNFGKTNSEDRPVLKDW